MKLKSIFMSALLLSACTGVAQNGFPWINPDTILNFQPCPYDTSVSIWMYEGFKVYHTLNDEPDGQIDSLYCIGFGESATGDYFYIDGNTINHQKPLFISWGETSVLSGLQLEPHMVFDVDVWINSSKQDLMDTTNCPNGKCVRFSAFFDKEVTQDSIVSIKYNDASYWYGSSQYGSWYEGSTRCLPTEKHPNHLDSLFVKIDVASNDSFKINFGIEFGDHQLIDTSDLWQYVEDTFNYHFYDWWNPNYLFFHPDSSIPSAQNVHYYDFSPVPNTDSADTVNISTSSFYVSLVLESFVQFRGGLPNQDSNRHILNVFYDSADYCMYGFVERVFGAQTNLVHKSGPLTVRDKACVMFMNGSELRLTKNSLLHYGLDGSGMMAVRPQSRIKMHKGSKLLFQSKLVLLDEENSLQDEYVIKLPDGAQFEFAEGSSITNQFCANSNAKVVFELSGGYVDLSGLDEDSRKLVEIRYAQPSLLQADELQFPNPIQDKLKFTLESASLQSARLNIHDVNGTLVQSSEVMLQKGTNTIEQDMRSLPNSLYFVSIDNGFSIVSGKLVKQ